MKDGIHGGYSVHINKLQATCDKCKKEFDYEDVELFMLKGRNMCVCQKCCDQIIEFIKEK